MGTLINQNEARLNKIFLILIFILFFSKISHSKDYYYCKDFDYSVTGYPEKWGKSWVPENLLFIKDEDRITINGIKTVITEDSEKKIKFYRRVKHNSKKSGKNAYTIVKYIFFKTTDKLNVGFDLPSGFRNPGDIWGVCEVELASNKSSSQNSSLDSSNYNYEICKKLGFKERSSNFNKCLNNLSQ